MRISVLVVVASLALAGCGGQADGDESKTQTMTVKFHLADFDTAFNDCEGAGGYSDIGSGTPVVVKNGDGKVLGAGDLGSGASSSNGLQAAYCDWTVELPDVATGEGFYSVEVGSRGAITKSESDLAADHWQFVVSLGS